MSCHKHWVSPVMLKEPKQLHKWSRMMQIQHLHQCSLYLQLGWVCLDHLLRAQVSQKSFRVQKWGGQCCSEPATARGCTPPSQHRAGQLILAADTWECLEAQQEYAVLPATLQLCGKSGWTGSRDLAEIVGNNWFIFQFLSNYQGIFASTSGWGISPSQVFFST